jgi:hypothetical protein
MRRRRQRSRAGFSLAHLNNPGYEPSAAGLVSLPMVAALYRRHAVTLCLTKAKPKK